MYDEIFGEMFINDLCRLTNGKYKTLLDRTEYKKYKTFLITTETVHRTEIVLYKYTNAEFVLNLVFGNNKKKY